MTTPRGPRIIFKDDRDSAVHRGCVVYAAHLRPEIICMVEAAAQTAPPLKFNTLIVSEGHREIRDTRDLHEEARAWDISLNQVDCKPDDLKAFALMWTEAIEELLGPSYDVVAHGKGLNYHIHIELDP